MTQRQTSAPLISVIMPVYNRAEFIRDAIESILRQTYENFEFIIADDGSTDESSCIINEYAKRDQRIRPFFFPHRGIPCTSNAAAALARGALTARQDSDDVALPDRLAAQYRWMAEKDVDICGCRFAFFTGRGDEDREDLRWQPESQETIIKRMLFGHPMLTGTMMMKSFICKENPFNETIDFIDTEWPMQMALKCKMNNVPKFLLKVRRHETNTTTLKKEAFKKSVRKARFSFFYHLFPRTPLPDYMAFVRLADGAPMTSLWELDRAGQWLVQFSLNTDEEFHQKLCKRWKDACDRSVTLGTKVNDIFSYYREMVKAYRNPF